MQHRDAIDRFLTWSGYIALGALLLAAFLWARGFKDLMHGNVHGVGGPLAVNGPLHVKGNLYVGGPATVHGPVQAKKLTIGGPIQTTLPKGEAPGQDGQIYDRSLAVGRPLTVQGPLVVDGRLIVGGPLVSEPE